MITQKIVNLPRLTTIGRFVINRLLMTRRRSSTNRSRSRNRRRTTRSVTRRRRTRRRHVDNIIASISRSTSRKWRLLGLRLWLKSQHRPGCIGTHVKTLHGKRLAVATIDHALYIHWFGWHHCIVARVIVACRLRRPGQIQIEIGWLTKWHWRTCRHARVKTAHCAAPASAITGWVAVDGAFRVQSVYFTFIIN